ncbi:MAG: hypothetical protein IKB64_08535 [Paludibacteraceae bacterium]|nr:hypothetical protein [Paludibacteraceae bacterium]
MEFSQIISLIGTLGFPIVACLVMGWFIFKIYKNTTAESAKNMEQVQARCKEREEKLYNELGKAQEINAQAIATIAVYTERLGIVEQDVKYIREKINENH